MSQSLVLFIILVLAISVIASILLVIWSYKRKKTLKKESKTGLWIFIMVFGMLFLLAGGGPLVFHSISTNGWEEVDATISNIASFQRTGKNTRIMSVEVTYKYQGRVYSGIELNYTSNSMREGQPIAIVVNPNKAEESSAKVTTVLPIYGALMGLGVLMLLFGLYNCIQTVRGKSRWVTAGENPPAITEDEEKSSQKSSKVLVIILPVCLLGGVGVAFYHAGFLMFICYLILKYELMPLVSHIGMKQILYDNSIRGCR